MLSILLVSFVTLIYHQIPTFFLIYTLRLVSNVASGLFSASSTTEFTIREIIRCLCLARDGIDAVLLVFSVRNRLTEEEQSTLHTLKILLGRQIVDHIIVHYKKTLMILTTISVINWSKMAISDQFMTKTIWSEIAGRKLNIGQKVVEIFRPVKIVKNV